MAEDTKEDLEYRKKRVKRIKKIIVVCCVILFVLPIILSLVLLCRVKTLERKIETIVSENNLEEGEEEPSADIVKAQEKQNVSEAAVRADETKKVYLTFDDGPSKQTEKVLDILEKKNVKATFFVIGREDEFSKGIYKRIVKEGHTLGMHSYSHIYKKIYGSLDGFQKDFFKLSDYLYEVTGQRSVYYRFPGGSSNSVKQFPVADYTAFLQEQGVAYMDWNVIAANGTTDHVSEEEMVKSVMDGVARYSTSVVLMYDSADKKMTAESLEAIIDNLQAEGYELLPIDADTVPVHHS